METSQEVLGITSFGPVEGSPLIPPEVITVYFCLFFTLLLLTYAYLHHKKRPVLIRHKIQLLVVTAISIKVLLIGGGGLLAAYWLIPTPNIVSTNPQNGQSNFPLNQKIEIVFDRPIDRTDLEKTITPEVPGFWMFENSLYTTHLYRKLVFIPTQSLKPETIYQIKLGSIKNLLGISEPYSYTYTFTAQSTPKVSSVSPVEGALNVDINQPVVVYLSQQNNQISQFDFTLSPPLPLDIKLNPDKLSYNLTPSSPFQQGTKYQLLIKKTDLILNTATNTIVEQSPTVTETEIAFTTKEAPGIVSSMPSGQGVSLTTPISISFSQAMNRSSVEKNLVIEPVVAGRFEWLDDQTVTFKPTAKLAFDTTYKLTLKAGTEGQGSEFLEADITKEFSTIGRVKVSSASPKNGWAAASIDSPIKIEFNQPVDKPSAEAKFSLNPQLSGSYSWEKNTLVFTPSNKLPFSTRYQVSVSPGVKTVSGLDSTESYTSSFTTQEQTFKLAVPAYLQRYTLSCELAALRMALNFRGANVSEDTLIEIVGVDPTPHQGNVWGNPNLAFVGNVRGSQMKDGYGVHWGPIARAARTFRSATEFTGWQISQLTDAIAGGNPVVIWVYSGGGYPTTWKTPDGTDVYAARDEHAVTAVGFVGPTSNPSQIIINDPLYGQVYWTRALFDKKWRIFNNSGVVVY